MRNASLEIEDRNYEIGLSTSSKWRNTKTERKAIMAKRYFTAVIELPEDQAAAKAVLQALPLFGEFNGGTVTAVYALSLIHI